MRRIAYLLPVLFLIFFWVTKVQADSPGCTYNSDGSITCIVEDGGSQEDNESTLPDNPNTCAPGEIRNVNRTSYVPEAGGTCTMFEEVIDACSGNILAPGNIEYGMTCPQAVPPPPRNPCNTFLVTASGITCDAGNGWRIVATVRFPQTYLDVRPFPATLVRWPTAIRNGGMPSSSGSGTQGYFGTRSRSSPNVGDWSNIRLTLTLNPASSMFITLPYVGALSLPDQSAVGTPHIIQWEVPSHPEVGSGPLAGSVTGMEELPNDMPLFVGSGRSAYRLFWQLTYNVYESVERCLPGPDLNGDYDCRGNTGHTVVTGYKWGNRSSGGEIPPSAVTNLPALLAADLNGDGLADAYWNNNLTLRRMDDAGSVNNPAFRRTWNWGGRIYWAVREGQGQIGWPGEN